MPPTEPLADTKKPNPDISESSTDSKSEDWQSNFASDINAPPKGESDKSASKDKQVLAAVGDALNELLSPSDKNTNIARFVKNVESLRIDKAKDRNGNRGLYIKMASKEPFVFATNENEHSGDDQINRGIAKNGQIKITENTRFLLTATPGEEPNLELNYITGINSFKKRPETADDSKTDDSQESPAAPPAPIEHMLTSLKITPENIHGKLKTGVVRLPFTIPTSDLVQGQPGLADVIKDKQIFSDVCQAIQSLIDTDYFKSLELKQTEEGKFDLNIETTKEQTIKAIPGISIELANSLSAKIEKTKDSLKISEINGISIQMPLLGNRMLSVSSVEFIRNTKGESCLSLQLSNPNNPTQKLAPLMLPIKQLIAEAQKHP